jgi:DNA-binding SARP family transcriptional activator
MRFRVLGDVRKVGTDPLVTTGAAYNRTALLALLVLHANRAVSQALIWESVWPDGLPAHPDAALQVLVSRLRVELGPYAAHLVTDTSGYRLDVDTDDVDLSCAEGLLRQGRAALANNRAAAAARHFERALTLWTDDPLEQFAHVAYFRDTRARIQELRLALVEARNDAYLLAGRHLEVLADIDRWVASDPFREHLRAQQIAALYRAGRQVDALRRCASFRESLIERGLDLSPAMRLLERRVLQHDPALLATGAGFMTALPAWTEEVLPFIGRDVEYERVLSRLAEATRGGVRFVLVEGQPGVGKSRFLIEVARRVGTDAIVLSVDAHGAFSPSLYALVRVLAEAVEAISDDELRPIMATDPSFGDDIAAVRAVTTALNAGEPIGDVTRDARILQYAARWIAALSVKAPVILVIDDLEAASASLLHVVAQLGVMSMPNRVLVVASAREHVNHAFPQLARLVTAFERLDIVERITLRPLEPRDIDEILERMRVSPRSRIVDRLYELTSGNPWLLAELLNTGPAELVVTEWESPPQMRDIVRRRAAEMGRPTAQLLQQASIFEHDFTIDLLADVTGASPNAITRLVERAVEAHILQLADLRSYRFAHQLFRQAMVADLPPKQRADGHRRIAIALESRGQSSAALLAAHWSAASGADAPAKVVQYARDAGREALQLFEPNTAVRWFELALGDTTDDHQRGASLSQLAQAQYLTGDSRDLTTLREAIHLAVATQDDALGLQIICEAMPGWSTLYGATGPDTSPLLNRALKLETDDATRSRLLARLALEQTMEHPALATQTVEEALALARKSGDRTALAESLFRKASLLLSPHSLDERRAALRELRDVAPATDVVMRYFICSTDAVASIEAGELAQADISATEADAIASRYDISPIRWSATIRHAWRAALAGNFDDAETFIEQASAFGQTHNIAHAPDLALAQRCLAGWQQGRLGSILPAARAAHERYGDSVPAMTLILARALADGPDTRDEAQAIVASFHDTQFASLRIGAMWSTALILTAETAQLLQLPEACRTICDLLLPYARQMACSGSWVTAPMAYGIGMAASGCGDPQAKAQFEYAIKLADRLEAPALAAQAQHALEELT